MPGSSHRILVGVLPPPLIVKNSDGCIVGVDHEVISGIEQVIGEGNSTHCFLCPAKAGVILLLSNQSFIAPKLLTLCDMISDSLKVTTDHDIAFQKEGVLVVVGAESIIPLFGGNA